MKPKHLLSQKDLTPKRDQIDWSRRGFEIKFKCMKGVTTENGKFLMPLSEKLTHAESIDRCKSQGFSSKFDVD